MPDVPILSPSSSDLFSWPYVTLLTILYSLLTHNWVLGSYQPLKNNAGVRPVAILGSVFQITQEFINQKASASPSNTAQWKSLTFEHISHGDYDWINHSCNATPPVLPKYTKSNIITGITLMLLHLFVQGIWRFWFIIICHFARHIPNQSRTRISR